MGKEYPTGHYGTEEFKEKTKKEIFEDLISAMPIFFDVYDIFQNNISLNTLDTNSLDQLLNVLKIIKFGKKKSPYLVTFDFNPDSKDLTTISIWKDPKYDETEEDSAFTYKKGYVHNLVELENNPDHLFKLINGALSETRKPYITESEQETRLAGLKDEREIYFKKLAIYQNNRFYDKVAKNRVGLVGTTECSLIIGCVKKSFFKTRKPIATLRRH